MNRFWSPVIHPLLALVGARHVVEIGAAEGRHSVQLVRWCRRHGARLDVIDPKPAFDPVAFEAAAEGVARVHLALSLDVLPALPPADVVLIDGDHNWHTVFHELRALYGDGARLDDAAPVVVCHDVAWPYGRRDLYYDLDTIPPEGRQPARKGGLSPYAKGIVGEGLNAVLVHAETEGGPRNGVRTAIEDALAGRRDQVRIVWLEIMSGLAVIVPVGRLAANPDLAPWLDQFTPSRNLKALLALTERERLDGAVAQQKLALLAGNPATGAAPPEGRPFTSALSGEIWRGIQQGLAGHRYKGRALLLNPFDLAHYQALLGALRPGTVFEIGSYEGGRALWLADTLDALGIEGRVITIDVTPPDLADARIEVRQGNALALGAVLDEARLSALPRPFLVIEDAAHAVETSLAVLEFFDPHLRSGDYIVVEDAAAGLMLGDDVPAAPAQALMAFLDRRGPDYEIDAALCDRFGYNTTANLNGWLRRR